MVRFVAALAVALSCLFASSAAASDQFVFIKRTQNSAVLGGPTDASVWLTNAFGTTPVKVPNTNEATSASLSPDGSQIAYTEDPVDDGQQGYRSNLFVIKPDGTNKRLIGSDVWTASWSPDSTQLVATQGYNGNIVIYPLTGGLRRDVVTWGDSQRDPVFSPDGQSLAFTSWSSPSGVRTDTATVYRTTVAGANPIVLATDAQEPTYSPDGRTVAYVGARTRSIASVSSGGGASTTITSIDAAVVRSWLSHPSWSPDGLSIAYAQVTDNESSGTSDCDIRRVPRPTGTVSTLYSASTPGCVSAPAYAVPNGQAAAGEAPPVLAARFRPTILFDTSEKWRPVDIDAFTAERTSTGAAYHKICPNTTQLSKCKDVTSSASFRLFSTSAAVLDVNGSGAGTNYQSPSAACRVNGLLDCDTGTSASLYWHQTASSPKGYRYLDYWWFFRYNLYRTDAPPPGCPRITTREIGKGSPWRRRGTTRRRSTSRRSASTEGG